MNNQIEAKIAGRNGDPKPKEKKGKTSPLTDAYPQLKTIDSNVTIIDIK